MSLPPAPTVAVTAVAETDAVATRDADAADDPAIWRNADDPQASLIVATDKKAGLYVYGFDGAKRSYIDAGRVNNVELRGARKSTRLNYTPECASRMPSPP